MKQWLILAFLFVLLFCFGIIMEWGLVYEMGKVLFKIVPIFTPLIFAGGMFYIAMQQHKTASQQHKTNKDRLAMELFEKRYKIYESTINAMTKPWEEFDGNTILTIYKNIAPTCFLFENSEDIELFHRKILSAINDIIQFKEEINFGRVGRVPITKEQTKNLRKLLMQINSLRENAPIIFKDYLTLEG
jgi:hypothetical protein